jgi:hypothetical protein
MTLPAMISAYGAGDDDASAVMICMPCLLAVAM